MVKFVPKAVVNPGESAKAAYAKARNRAKKYTDLSFSLKAVITEFFAMTMFVFFGCGAALFFSAESLLGGKTAFALASTNTPLSTVPLDEYLKANSLASSWGIITALAFGIGIAVVVYNAAHISGGQVNPCVSTGLFLAGKLPPFQMAGNIIAQYVGSILGASLLAGVAPNWRTLTLSANAVSPTFNDNNALCGEIVMTCLLMFTVLQTACTPAAVAKNVAPLAIGLSVFCAHTVLIPVDGCSINPARSFGPALIAGAFKNFWVFNVGPWVGCVFGVLCHWALESDWDVVLFKNAQVDSNEVSNANAGVSDDALRIH